MIELLGNIIDSVFQLIAIPLELAADLIQLVFGLLGGFVSLLFSLLGIVLIAALIVLFVKRRARRKEKHSGVLIDENGEEFVSYYHQDEA